MSTNLNDESAIEGFGTFLFPLHCTPILADDSVHTHEANVGESQKNAITEGNTRAVHWATF